MQQIRPAPYHLLTQGKIERIHRTIQKVVKHRNYNYPWELAQAIEAFVEYYNHERYLEALDSLTLIDVSSGRSDEVVTYTEQIKHETLQYRKRFNLKLRTWIIKKRIQKVSLNRSFHLSHSL